MEPIPHFKFGAILDETAQTIECLANQPKQIDLKGFAARALNDGLTTGDRPPDAEYLHEQGRGCNHWRSRNLRF